MKTLTWDQSMSVEVDVLDLQHQRIANYINELEQARQTKDDDAISEAMFNVFEYLELHFTSEETLMEAAAYPLFEVHKKAHQSFLSRLANYFERHEQGEDVVQKFHSEVSVWWISHINSDDQDYVPYLKKLSKREWIKKLVDRGSD